VLVKETGPARAIVIATGSEVQHAVEGRAKGKPGVRVVSCPAWSASTARAPIATSVLPPSCTKRIAIEAGVSGLWWKYVGTQGQVIGIDRFGISAPGNTVMKELGITAESLVGILRREQGLDRGVLDLGEVHVVLADGAEITRRQGTDHGVGVGGTAGEPVA
jgi:transketolase